jgi:hypothetical protein
MEPTFVFAIRRIAISSNEVSTFMILRQESCFQAYFFQVQNSPKIQVSVNMVSKDFIKKGQVLALLSTGITLVTLY